MIKNRVVYCTARHQRTTVYDMQETRSVVLQVRVKPSTSVSLREAADKERRELSDFIRLLLAEGLEKRR